MLRLIARKGDGWFPSQVYLKPGGLAAGNAVIDQEATRVGRDPREVRRLLNIGGGPSGAQPWQEELAQLAIEDGVSTFIAVGDDPQVLARFGQEVAPAVRELVNAHRAA